MVWLMSEHIMGTYNEAVEGFYMVNFKTSDQHCDATKSRMSRDMKDLQKGQLPALTQSLSADTVLTWFISQHCNRQVRFWSCYCWQSIRSWWENTSAHGRSGGRRLHVFKETPNLQHGIRKSCNSKSWQGRSTCWSKPAFSALCHSRSKSGRPRRRSELWNVLISTCFIWEPVSSALSRLVFSCKCYSEKSHRRPLPCHTTTKCQSSHWWGHLASQGVLAQRRDIFYSHHSLLPVSPEEISSWICHCVWWVRKSIHKRQCTREALQGGGNWYWCETFTQVWHRSREIFHKSNQ